MKKETKIRLEKLDKKALKLTESIWKEPKANMRNKNTEMLIEIRKEMEDLRKKEG